MKLKLETPIKSLTELEVSNQEILLFSKYQKSMWLLIDSTGFSFVVKDKDNSRLFSVENKFEAQSYYDLLYLIPKEITDNFVSFKAFIETMDLGIHYEIDFRSYKSIGISTHTRGGSDYHWALYDKRGIFNRYPMATKDTIKSFKTIEGAKKSLISEIKKLF